MDRGCIGAYDRRRMTRTRELDVLAHLSYIVRVMSEDAERSLEQLDEEERAISARRLRLHDRIEFLRGTGVGEPDAAERLAKLLEEENQASRRRRELHGLIDARRTELGLEARAPAKRESLRDR